MIEIKGLTKKYKSFLLDNVSFELPVGKVVGLIGPNGAGKSTIIKILVGLEERTEGEILVDGQSVSKLGDVMRIGFLSQNLEIYPGQKMSDIMKFVRNAYKKVWNEKLYKYYLLDVFNLKDDLKINELSTGMRVKFFLALELAKEPECLLLDEATSGLDPMIRDEVLDILIKLAEEKNLPILLSSHITEDLEKVGDYVTYIDTGKILLEDTVSNIRNNYRQVEANRIESMEDVEKCRFLDNALLVHQYYVYEKKAFNRENDPGTPALLSDVLSYLRKEEKND